MTRMRYAEFPTPALPRIVFSITASALIGLIAGWLTLFVPLLALEERAVDVDRKWRRFDALSRYAVGIIFVLILALVPLAVASWHWVSLTGRRAIEELAPQRPDQVVTPHQLSYRPTESRKTLRVTLYGSAGTLLGVGAFLFIFGLISLADDVPQSIEAVIIGAAMLTLGVAMFWWAWSLRRGFSERSPRKTWSDDLAQARQQAKKAAASQGRRPIPGWLRVLRVAARVAGVLVGVGVVVTAGLVMLGVGARKPCRTCDERTFGEGIELTLDRFWMGIVVLAILVAVIILVHGLLGALSNGLTRRVLLQRIERGDVDDARPEQQVLAQTVGEESGPWDRIGHFASLWGPTPLALGACWWLVGRVGHTQYVETPAPGQWLLGVGAVMTIVMVVSAVLSEVTNPAQRDAIREAWPVDQAAAAHGVGNSVSGTPAPGIRPRRASASR
ncbi:hypothetical protein ACQB6R_08940 [Propionibacteriaceae bacterium G1746]